MVERVDEALHDARMFAWCVGVSRLRLNEAEPRIIERDAPKMRRQPTYDMSVEEGPSRVAVKQQQGWAGPFIDEVNSIPPISTNQLANGKSVRSSRSGLVTLIGITLSLTIKWRLARTEGLNAGGQRRSPRTTSRGGTSDRIQANADGCITLQLGEAVAQPAKTKVRSPHRPL